MLIHDPVTGRSYFSKRRRRFDSDRMPRELTFSCYHKLPLLSPHRTRQWFVDSLKKERLNWPIDLWAWALMPEHVHLLVAPRETGVEIGRFQGAVKEQTAKLAIAWLEQHAPAWVAKLTVREGRRVRRRFWQPGGGYDRNIDNMATLEASIHYLHNNPLRRGLVSSPLDWEWSSARWYAGIRPVQIDMDATIAD